MKKEISVEEHNKNQIIHQVISTCICFVISGFYYNYNYDFFNFWSFIAVPVTTSVPVLIYNWNTKKNKGKINAIQWYLLQNFFVVLSFLGSTAG